MSIFKKLSLFLVLALILPIVVNAEGGISVSTKSINLALNESKTFTINATNLAGRVDISTSDASVVSISSTKEFFDTSLNASSATITVTGKRAGTATIRVATADVETFDGETITSSYTINVNVSDPVTTTPQVPQNPTTKSSANTKKPATKKTTTANNNSTTTSTTKTSEEIITNPIENSTTSQAVSYNGAIELDKFGVVGYDLKKEDGKYILNIAENVKEIYVIANSKDENVKISGTGIVNIKNKNRIVIDVEKEGLNSKYIIKINKKRDNASIIIGALIIIIIGLLVYIIIDWKKNKSYR